jgi:hypothetical protein
MVNLTQKWGVVRFCKVFSHDRRWVACTHPPKDRNCGLLHVSSYTHLVTMNHNDIMVRSTTIQNHQAYPLSHQSQSQINTLRNSGNVIYIYMYIYISMCVYMPDGYGMEWCSKPNKTRIREKNVFFLVCFPIDWSTRNPRNDYSILNRRCVTGTRERGWLAP